MNRGSLKARLLVIGMIILGTVLSFLHGFYGIERPRTVLLRKDLEVYNEADEVTLLEIGGTSSAMVGLVLDTLCAYCEENVPAWKRIAQDITTTPAEAELAVFSASPPTATRNYLARHGLAEAAVWHVSPRTAEALSVSMFPATFVLDQATGSVVIWDGVLSERDTIAIIEHYR